MKRVSIIGAGVVGLILAEQLASQGIDVTVYDSKKKVSDNTAKASGIFSKEGLEKIDIDYKKALQNTLTGAILHAGKENLKISSGTTKAYVLDRGLFADECARAAVVAGAKLVMGKRFDREEIVKMKEEKDNIIVGADGAISNVASAIGFPAIKEYVLTYKAEYENARINDKNAVELFFSNKITSRFFGWTVPYSSTKLEVGIGISSFSKRTSSQAFAQFVETEYMKGILADAKKVVGYASIIPLEFRSKTVIDNVLLVGDAAGQVKATTGGGIIFGVSCAKIAAKAIVAHIKDGRDLAMYEKDWRKQHELDLQLHKLIHTYYSSLNERSLSAMFTLSKLLGIDNFLSAYGDMDRPSLVLKRFFLRGKLEN